MYQTVRFCLVSGFVGVMQEMVLKKTQDVFTAVILSRVCTGRDCIDASRRRVASILCLLGESEQWIRLCFSVSCQALSERRRRWCWRRLRTGCGIGCCWSACAAVVWRPWTWRASHFREVASCTRRPWGKWESSRGTSCTPSTNTVSCGSCLLLVSHSI